MSLPEANINNTGSLAKMLEAIRTAGVPERVTFEFLKTIGFKSSNDRPIIPVLKAIGFLDANGAPTERYRAYRGQNGPRVLAKALESAYSDLFLANTKANSLSLEKLKAIIASKSNKGNAIVERIARTFQVLCKTADFTESADDSPVSPPTSGSVSDPSSAAENSPIAPPIHRSAPSFHYNIEIHLPTTTDITVYNAIFKSLKENLI